MTAMSPSAPMAQLGLIDPGYGSLGGMVSEPDPVVEIPAMIGGGSMDIEPTPWFGAPESAEMRNALATGVAGMNVPLLSDASGLYADLDLMYREPEERTWFNVGLTGLGLLPFIPNMTVWHGSPHLFDKFDISKIGTGEGAQMYGHGLYVAQNRDVAEGNYWNKLANRVPVGPQGELYEIPWDEAPESVRSLKDYYKDVVVSPKRLGDEIQSASGLARQAEKQGLHGVAENTRKKVEWLQKVAKEAPRTRKSGALYEVDLPDEHIDRMLDWDAGLEAQVSPEMRNWLQADVLTSPSARDLEGWLRYHNPSIDYADPEGVGEALRKLLDLDFDITSIPPEDLQALPEFQTLLQASRQDPTVLSSMLHTARQYGDDALGRYGKGALTGRDLARTLYKEHGAEEAARIMHQDWGLPGIKYLDEGSRGLPTGSPDATRNFVVFDDELLTILNRYTDD